MQPAEGSCFGNEFLRMTKNGGGMSEPVMFSVEDVLRDVETAVKEGKTRLFSQTLYQFLPDDDKLTIQDFDVIVLCDQCRHNIPKLTLKSIRKTLTPKASFFECNDVSGVRAVIRGGAVNGEKLEIAGNQGGLMDVRLNASHLHSGRIYVVRVNYDVPLKRDKTSQLMFSGAIQPSDYHGICKAIGLPLDAKKTMEVVVLSGRPFSVWFYDPRENEYFPTVVKSEFDKRRGYFARHPFHHELKGDDLRARYFSIFVNLSPQESVFPGNPDWDMLGDAALGV